MIPANDGPSKGNMMDESHSVRPGGWLEASGLPHLLRIIGISLQPAKLGLGLIAIVMTFIVGGVLDLVWTSRAGIHSGAIEAFIASRELDQPYVEPTGDLGPFHIWREHSRRRVLGLLGSSFPASDVAAGTPLGAYFAQHAQAQPLRNIVEILQGVWWLISQHTFYFGLFGTAALLIWSACGGAICRLAAVQFARDEKISSQQGWAFVRQRLFGGFFLAPCIPLAIILVVVLFMLLGGLLLRIPFLGDLIGGVLFIFAILGGFGVFLLLLGLIVGGSLFWPAVATEGADGFDAFSRGVSYPLTKPLRFIWYVVISTLLAALSWVFANMSVYFALRITRAVVAAGTSPFGWAKREANGQTVSKLELLWPLGGPNALYAWPNWSMLGVGEYISALLIGVYVLLVIGLMWSFLASFYFSASTVIYFLLRRDVDGADLEDVLIAEELDETGAPIKRDSVPSATTGTPLPIMNQPRRENPA
jgi:hypothetical protein